MGYFNLASLEGCCSYFYGVRRAKRGLSTVLVQKGLLLPVNASIQDPEAVLESQAGGFVVLWFLSKAY